MPQTVQFGSFGDAVKLLQQALNLWPKSTQPPLDVDGDFGPITRSKVVEFQSKNSLAPDGVVGPLTWGQLEPWIKKIKEIVPIPTDETAAGQRIVAGAEAALGALGWTTMDKYSPLNPRIAAAKCADDGDPRRPRQGGTSLAQIFMIAEASGGYVSRCPTISSKAVQMWQQQNEAGTVWRNGNDLCAWCGIFTVYVLRSVGFSVPNGWASQKEHVKDAQSAFFKGSSGSVYRLFTNPAQAFPGCIGVIHPSASNHHFIVTNNNGGVINSIDGN
jgi:peptidoglycan hydrolase-like protein with peptidoglycan-binding domain